MMIPRRDFLASSAALLTGLAAGAAAQPASTAPTPVPRPVRGLTLAGGEFGADSPDFCNECPGRIGWDYTYNSERTVAWFAREGFTLFRIPFRWERVQPRLGEPLNDEEIGRLRRICTWATRHGCQVSLDAHNFCRYVLHRDEERIEAVIDQPAGQAGGVTRQHFADLWRRLSIAFARERGVWAYGLMNEPHDLGASDWKVISQAAVDSIRQTGDARLILVPGVDWTGAGRFADANGTWAWVNDPAGQIAYEAHCYFDSDASGDYALSYDRELALDPGLEYRGVRRLLHFAGWCSVNGVRGFIGEYGVPGDDPRWLTCLRHFLEALDKSGMQGCCWAAGEWWPPSARLSLQPREDFTQPAPQIKVLLGNPSAESPVPRPESPNQ